MSDGTALTVIGGYLGAGKTTLLNYLLHHNDGLRLALVVNDFGDINIDADLLTSTDGEVLALANGCICCTLVDGLANVLTDLRGRADTIDHVVIEASGVSDPLKIAHCGLAFGFTLGGVIVVADAEQVQVRANDKYVGETVLRNLQSADLLVLNKTDLVDPDQLGTVRQWLAALAPTAPIVETDHGQVPTPILLGHLHDASEHRNDNTEATPPHQHYESWSFNSEAPLDRSHVEAFLAALPGNVLRAKGFVRFADDPDQLHLLQVVGRRSTLTRHRFAEARPETRLTLIGLPGSIDAELYRGILTGMAH